MVAQEQKDLRIRQIQEALRYAEQANVIKPQIQQTQDVTQDSMFLLGSDALKSMIEHEATRPLVFYKGLLSDQAKSAGYRKSENRNRIHSRLPLRHEADATDSS